jgi:ATP synthase protein I
VGSVSVTMVNKTIRTQLMKIVFWQLLMVVGLALVIIFLQGIQRSWAALLGGMSYWLPTLIFMWRVSAYAGARAASRFVAAFFAGEVVKLFLSATLFVLLVKYASIDVVYGLIGLIGAIVAFWIASMTSLYRQGVKP